MITCQFEDNPKQASLRHVVVDALVIQDKKILLTKRSPKLRNGGKWAIPGGYVERDELIAEAVMREVHEETGYTSEVLELVTVKDNPVRRNDDRQNVTFLFLMKPIKQVGKPDPEEVTELKWFPLDTLPIEADMAFDHLELIWEWLKEQDTVL